MAQNYKQEYENLVESLSDELLHDIDSAKEHLENSGYNLEEVSKEGLDFIASLKRKKRVELAKQKQFRLAKLRELFLSKLDSISTHRIDEIASILSNGQQLSFEYYHNKLSKMTKEDIEQMKDEQLFLAWLEDRDESKD